MARAAVKKRSKADWALEIIDWIALPAVLAIMVASISGNGWWALPVLLAALAIQTGFQDIKDRLDELEDRIEP